MMYGFIICAGRQSRFKSDIPKVLMKIDGKTLLERNIEAMRSCCDKVFTVCSVENQHWFAEENKIVIHSGKGSGDAVWQALERVECGENDVCLIMWGDTLHTGDIFRRLQENYHGTTLIPCIKEAAPYVQIIPDAPHTVKVRFSKFQEPTGEGYHDLSLFCCPASTLLIKLREFRNGILQADGFYRHKHGNEMEFLDVFNETNIQAEILDCEGYEDFSFNTMEQFLSLREKKSESA